MDQRPRRKNTRLHEYDYSQAGAYFVTIRTQAKRHLFGTISGNGITDLSDAGRMIEYELYKLMTRFPNLSLDRFVIMPDHLHAIFILTDPIQSSRESCIRTPGKGDHKDRRYARPHAHGTYSNSLGRIIQAFKSITTHAYITGVREYRWPPFPRRLWQCNYYEHIIRNPDDLESIRSYINQNPARWLQNANLFLPSNSNPHQTQPAPSLCMNPTRTHLIKT